MERTADMVLACFKTIQEGSVGVDSFTFALQCSENAVKMQTRCDR